MGALFYFNASVGRPLKPNAPLKSFALIETTMEDYTIVQKLGSGSFGNVWKALKKKTAEVVAVKELKTKFRNKSLEDCLNLMEVKSLRRLRHPNIVQLKEVIREYDSLLLIFECMDCSLHDLMKKRQGAFSEDEVRNFCFQIFKGLAYMHGRGFFHRDLKPENLLVSKDCIKIADLGSAREINSEPPYTEYITTRWYRSPEVLLQSTYYGEAKYDSAVDMWAMGAIMAEFYRVFPLFPGKNGADQIYQICRVLGSPTENEWPQGHELARGFLYEFPQIDDSKALHLSSLIPSVNPDAFNLIKSLLTWDPCKRPTALEALQHPFFQSCYPVSRNSVKRKTESEIADSSYKKLFLNCKKRAIRTAPKKPLNIF